MSSVGYTNAVATIRGPRLANEEKTLEYGVRSSSATRFGSLENIVALLDGSQFAEHAIPLAIAIAKRSGGMLKLVRAFAPPESGTLHRGWDAFEILERQMRADARRYLERTRRRILARVSGLNVLTQFAEAQTVTEGVILATKTADLVVMATHRRGWLSRIFLGSVGHDMLHKHRRPIIYLRGYDSPVDFSADPVPRHLTIAVDGRKASTMALGVVGALARLGGARSTLLHVVDPRTPRNWFPQDNPRELLRGAQRELLKASPDVWTHVIRKASSPSQGILSFVEEAEPDLLAVTTRFGTAAFQSTTANLIRKSPVPVLVVRESVTQDNLVSRPPAVNLFAQPIETGEEP